jgi:hypothetical protein
MQKCHLRGQERKVWSPDDHPTEVVYGMDDTDQDELRGDDLKISHDAQNHK